MDGIRPPESGYTMLRPPAFTPLAQKDVDKLRKVVEELYTIAKNADADIARLGEERIIVTPSGVKIWKPDYDLK